MRNVGIIGVGYTPVFVSKRKDVNIAEMISESVDAALENTNLTPEDIDALTFGNMQTFEGMNLPHLWVSEHMRALDKPVIRISTRCDLALPGITRSAQVRLSIPQLASVGAQKPGMRRR